MQDGRSPAHEASANGHTEILALLLSNKADANTADKVEQLKLF
jgi:ankyrin repeat protein